MTSKLIYISGKVLQSMAVLMFLKMLFLATLTITAIVAVTLSLIKE